MTATTAVIAMVTTTPYPQTKHFARTLKESRRIFPPPAPNGLPKAGWLDELHCHTTQNDDPSFPPPSSSFLLPPSPILTQNGIAQSRGISLATVRNSDIASVARVNGFFFLESRR